MQNSSANSIVFRNKFITWVIIVLSAVIAVSVNVYIKLKIDEESVRQLTEGDKEWADRILERIDSIEKDELTKIEFREFLRLNPDLSPPTKFK